jgi:hypothetical protein
VTDWFDLLVGCWGLTIDDFDDASLVLVFVPRAGAGQDSILTRSTKNFSSSNVSLIIYCIIVSLILSIFQNITIGV